MNDLTELEPQTAPVSMVGQLVRAEIDQQIATAHAYPRSITKVNRSVLSLVTMSPAAAEKCGYALPRGGKPILGPSIRLAEIVAGQWGNCRVGSRVVHVDRIEKYVEAEGIFHDLETNTATTARVRRRIVDSKGRLFSDDMIIVTGNAACSIAKRNAVLAGVPEAVWGEAYEAALAVVKGDVVTLPERRAETMKAFAAFGVTPDQIFASLEIGGMDDIGLDQIATLRTMYKSIKDGEQQVEDFFPAKTGAAGVEAAKGTATKLSDIAKAAKPRDEAAAQREADIKAAENNRADDAKRQAMQDERDAAAKQRDDAEINGQVATDAETGNDEPAVSDEQAQEAYKSGFEARKAGRKQAACPAPIRAAQRLFDAWNEGWDEADEALRKDADGRAAAGEQ